MKDLNLFQGQLANNIFSMLTLRGLEYILAFLMVPYLLRTLGPTKFGAVAFMQGIIQYFNIFIDYGFNLTAPKCIAKSSAEKLPKMFSTFFLAKMGLCVMITLLSFIIYTILRKEFAIQIDYLLFLVTYISVIGNVLFPIWFFQGIQRMKYITILNMIGRFITMAGIFIFVCAPEDYVLAAFFQSCTPVFAGIGALFIIYKNYPTIWCMPSVYEIYNKYKEGCAIFLSMLAVNLYTSSNIIILGIMTNNTIVGYYSGASKLIDCIRRLIDAVNQAVYPYICGILKKDYVQAMLFLKKILKKFFYLGIVIAIIILFGSKYIISIILGANYMQSVVIFRTMAFIPCVVAISTVFGGLTMLPLEMQNEYSYTLVGSAVLSLILVVPLTFYYGPVGTAMTSMVTESFIMIVMGAILIRKHILINNS